MRRLSRASKRFACSTICEHDGVRGTVQTQRAVTAGDGRAGSRTIKDLYRYVWRTSGRSQILLSVLAVAVFLLELAPLELQRRIVNNAVEQQAYQSIALLCGLYLVVALRRAA